MEILPRPTVSHFLRANCQFTGRVIVTWNKFHVDLLPIHFWMACCWFPILTLAFFKSLTSWVGSTIESPWISHTSPTSCDLFGTVMQWCFRGLYSAWRMANATWKHRMPWDDWDMALPGKEKCMESKQKNLKQRIQFSLDCGWENGSKSITPLFV